MSSAFHGIWGRPYVDLEEHLSCAGAESARLSELHDEITRGLLEVETTYTGGSLKWMGICAESVMRDPYRDVNLVLEGLSTEEFRMFASLEDDRPHVLPCYLHGSLGEPRADPERTPRIFGDETDRPLSRRQMRWLEIRHGVYFPWKTCYHFLENERWEDKHSGSGKRFAESALEHFPKMVAFLRALPFREIGRAVLFGVDANDHAPFHRDSEPGKTLTVAHSISIHPDPRKRLSLLGRDGETTLEIPSRLFWFNDMDYHGVRAQPFFSYSVRVDGVFDPAWLKNLEASVRRAPAR